MNLDTARRFVAALTGDPETPMRLRFIHDKDRTRDPAERFGTVAALQGEIEAFQSQGYACFYVLNESTAPVDGMVADADVTRVRALPADFDHGLPWDWHAKPALVVTSSPGRAQALWLGECTLDEFRPLCERVIAHYDSDKTIKNLSRVLRLPGTYNLKREEPHLVTFEDTGVRADVRVGLPALAPVKAASASVGDPVAFERLVEALRHVDPDVEYPDWRDVIGAVRATNSGTEEERLALVDAWSQRGSKYAGREDVERVWDTMPPKPGGVGWGTLYHKAGFTGPSAPVQPGSVVFGATIHLPGRWYTGAEIMARTPVPLREIIPGLVERDVVTFLAGPGGSMKSRLAIQWGLSIDAGLPVWGRDVEQSTFVYLSYEDHIDEVTRRAHAIAKRLEIAKPRWHMQDMVGLSTPLAVVGDDLTLTDHYHRFRDKVADLNGHKFVVIDSTYNALAFTGNAKINEASVQMGIGCLSQLCKDADATIVCLWHPSSAGQQRGDASGWSVAWHNTPRARLSIAAVEDEEGQFLLKVEKRNNAARPKDPLTLFWDMGTLSHARQVTSVATTNLYHDELVRIVGELAQQKTPIKKRATKDDPIPTWAFDALELILGRRPKDRDVRNELATLLNERKIRYKNNEHGNAAGYYPWNEGLDKAPSASYAGSITGPEKPGNF